MLLVFYRQRVLHWPTGAIFIILRRPEAATPAPDTAKVYLRSLQREVLSLGEHNRFI